MLMEGSEHAFVVNIPGFAGFAATVFLLMKPIGKANKFLLMTLKIFSK